MLQSVDELENFSCLHMHDACFVSLAEKNRCQSWSSPAQLKMMLVIASLKLFNIVIQHCLLATKEQFLPFSKIFSMYISN